MGEVSEVQGIQKVLDGSLEAEFALREISEFLPSAQSFFETEIARLVKYIDSCGHAEKAQQELGKYTEDFISQHQAALDGLKKTFGIDLTVKNVSVKKITAIIEEITLYLGMESEVEISERKNLRTMNDALPILKAEHQKFEYRFPADFRENPTRVREQKMIELNKFQHLLDFIRQLVQISRLNPGAVNPEGKTTPLVKPGERSHDTLYSPAGESPTHTAEFTSAVGDRMKIILDRIRNAIIEALSGATIVSTPRPGDWQRTFEDIDPGVIAALRSELSAREKSPAAGQEIPVELKIDQSLAQKIVESFYQAAEGQRDHQLLIELIGEGRMAIMKTAHTIPSTFLRVHPSDTYKDIFLKMITAAGAGEKETEDQARIIHRYIMRAHLNRKERKLTNQ